MILDQLPPAANRLYATPYLCTVCVIEGQAWIVNSVGVDRKPQPDWHPISDGSGLLFSPPVEVTIKI